MSIYKERVLPVRLIGKRHLLPHLVFLLLAHPYQCSLILLVQSIIIPPQNQNKKTERSKSRNDADFARNVTGSLLGLECLGAKDVANSKRD